MKARGELARDAVVATVMSNIGFERALRARGIELIRAAVGDRYVLEAMREGGYTLGGEQSGHVVDFRLNTTGDGPRTAITLFGIVASQRTTLRELVRDVVYAPQILLNVRSVHRGVLDVRPCATRSQRERGVSRNRGGSSSALPAPSRSSGSWPRATTARSSRPLQRASPDE